MFFGGFQKQSFIDYPGKLSCVLFASGCNFDCPYCHNPDLVKNGMSCPQPIDEETIWTYLGKRKGFLDGVVISGGEPTLQRDLVSVCEKIQEMGYPIKLDTNGSRPQVIQDLIEKGLVDYIAMDLKTDPCQYFPMIRHIEDPQSIHASIQVVMASDLPYEFRTTCVRPLVGEETVKNIAKAIKGARLYALQRFLNNGVLHPEFFMETGSGCDEDELMQLKEIAAPWVQECIVR
jgi:pyruvate formate lyase activating enzyme